MADFPNEQLSTIEVILAEYCGPERIRVLRCIIHLANGDIPRLIHNIAAAKNDYRNAIYFAEYDLNDQKIHDFNQPFVAQQSASTDETGSLPRG